MRSNPAPAMRRNPRKSQSFPFLGCRQKGAKTALGQHEVKVRSIWALRRASSPPTFGREPDGSAPNQTIDRRLREGYKIVRMIVERLLGTNTRLDDEARSTSCAAPRTRRSSLRSAPPPGSLLASRGERGRALAGLGIAVTRWPSRHLSSAPETTASTTPGGAFGPSTAPSALRPCCKRSWPISDPISRPSEASLRSSAPPRSICRCPRYFSRRGRRTRSGEEELASSRRNLV